MEVASRENATASESIHDLEDIVKKIARSEKIDESREFASDIQDSLAKRIQKQYKPVKDRGVRKAPFVVLIGADMPSILTEISFLSNPADEQLFKSFIDKFEPNNQALIRSVRWALRKRLPTANELVYDNYNFFVIGYCPNERPSDSIFSIAAGANGVGLCFIRGASLPDPHKILLGSGTQTRFIRLESAKTLALPEVEELISVAIAKSKVPLPTGGAGTLVIRSVSKKQRPRRKSK